MIFVGTTFTKSKHTIDASPNATSSLSSFNANSAVYDGLYITSKEMPEWDGETVETWDYSTALIARFNGNLLGGNVDFALDNMDCVKIKRRRVGEYTYKTYFKIPIKTYDDLKFTVFDYMAGIGDYEYAIVPSVNDVDGKGESGVVTSSFDGLWLVDGTYAIHAFLNLKLTHQRVKSGSSITTLGNKYPVYISNGNSNYTAGTVEATFVNMDSNCNFDFENGWKYREDVNGFLTNGYPKILKNDEGKMWLIDIDTSSIAETQNGHYQNVVHSFSWQECGDVDNMSDLFKAGIIDVQDNNITI